jgi:hypothetical protein
VLAKLEWRVQETKRINGLNLTEPARLAALADLMDQESALLQKIDKLRLTGHYENKEKQILALLERVYFIKLDLCA